jgi:hypothetical protein
MPQLTRRRYPERPDCWHVYFGDVHVGTMAIRAGVPVDVDQWGWSCGFHAEPNRYKQDEIALRQLHALKEHQGPREKKLGLSDVKAMFAEMKDAL